MTKWLGAVNPLPENPIAENSWNANQFKIECKNWLICIHNPTAYCLLIPEIKKADMKAFQLWFYPRLSEQFHYDGIEPELAAVFPFSNIEFFKTNNHKRMIGIMNRQFTDLKYSFPRWGGVDNLSLLEANHRFNDIPIGPSPYTWPIKEMRGFLAG